MKDANIELFSNKIQTASNCKKAMLYAHELPQDERGSMIKQAELNRNIRKEWLKSILKVKKE